MAGSELMCYLILRGAAIIETSRNKKEGQGSDDRVHYRTDDAQAHCGQYQHAHFLRVNVLHDFSFFEFSFLVSFFRQFFPESQFLKRKILKLLFSISKNRRLLQYLKIGINVYSI